MSIHAPRVLVLSVLLAAVALPLIGADDTMQVGERQVKVSPKKEITINYKSDDDADIQTRELWYSSFDGVQWSAWQKHGLSFAKDTPITWSPAEGHWRIYIRPIKVSGLSMEAPTAETHAKMGNLPNMKEFIIDRTAPRVAVGFPEPKAKLRGGVAYTVKWEATDPHLRNNPISIEWSRDGKGTFETVATDLPNSGAFDWTVPKDMTTTGILRITAVDKAGNAASAESGQILVDSVNPRGRVLGPAIAAKQDVTFDLDISDAGPAGLKEARLWISQDDGTSWTEGPFVTEPWKQVAWKAPGDGKYRLYILAIDQAGNPSPTPKGKADDQFITIVDSTQPTVQLGSAIGIVEAEKAASDRRFFKPGVRVAVPFTVKDANLQANSAAVYIQYDAAKGWELLGDNLPTDAAFRFEIKPVATRAAKIKVTAKDIAGNVGEAIAGESFVIDTEVKAGKTDVDL